MKLENRLYTYQEAAAILGMKPSGLRRMCKEGRGPTITQIGRLRRFDPESLHKFVKDCTDPRPASAG